MNRTEQFLSDLDEVYKGLPRHLKNIANQGHDIGYLIEHHPRQAERIWAHQMGRGTHLNDPDFTLRATGRTNPKTGQPVMSLGEAARAESRMVPAGYKVSGFGRKVAQPVGIGQMTPAQRQNWMNANTGKINRYRSKRPKPAAAPQQRPPARFDPATFRASPQQNTPLNTVARAHVAANNPTPAVHQTQAAPPPHQTHHPPAPPVQASPPPAQIHHQAPSTVPPQQTPPSRNERPVRNRWLRNSIAASLGLGATGAGVYTGVRSYRNQNRHPVRVRNQWEM